MNFILTRGFLRTRQHLLRFRVVEDDLFGGLPADGTSRQHGNGSEIARRRRAQGDVRGRKGFLARQHAVDELFVVARRLRQADLVGADLRLGEAARVSFDAAAVDPDPASSTDPARAGTDAIEAACDLHGEVLAYLAVTRQVAGVFQIGCFGISPWLVLLRVRCGPGRVPQCAMSTWWPTQSMSEPPPVS
jgi:hypothetical protein